MLIGRKAVPSKLLMRFLRRTLSVQLLHEVMTFDIIFNA